jgi:hypothetical protein
MFEVYRSGRGNSSPFPKIRVYRSGHIALNHAAFEALNCPRHVELALDVTNRRIGIRPAKDRASHTYTVSAANGGGLFVAKAFIRELFGSDFSPYHFEASTSDGYLIADIELDRAA